MASLRRDGKEAKLTAQFQFVPHSVLKLGATFEPLIEHILNDKPTPRQPLLGGMTAMLVLHRCAMRLCFVACRRLVAIGFAKPV